MLKCFPSEYRAVIQSGNQYSDSKLFYISHRFYTLKHLPYNGSKTGPLFVQTSNGIRIWNGKINPTIHILDTKLSGIKMNLDFGCPIF